MKGLAVLLVVAAPVAAQEPLPGFADCMDAEAARYERLLADRGTSDATAADIADVRGVAWCVGAGITACDRSAAPLECQRGLAGDIEALRRAVLATLPDASAGADPLYAALRGLADGRSAGPDCAGHTAVMAAWCGAHRAGLRLTTTMLAWQHARFLGRAPDGVAAGWARQPAPERPRARPGD